jgi:hypothetical protein
MADQENQTTTQSGEPEGRSASRERFRAWIAQWGFAILVGLAALVAAYLAWKAALPEQVPDFALKAEAVYRVEIGAATFLGIYLVIMAFALALNNRGFSEIGVNGVKAQDMADRAQQDAIQAHEETLDNLQTMIETLTSSTGESIESLKTRLKTLEEALEKADDDNS